MTPLYITDPTDVSDTNTEVQARAVLPLVFDGRVIAQTMARVSLQQVWNKITDTELGVGSFRLVSSAGDGNSATNTTSNTVHLWDNPFLVDGNKNDDDDDADDGNDDGAGFQMPESSVPLSDVILPKDGCDGPDPNDVCTVFHDDVASRINAGEYGYHQFQRIGPGGESETVNYNFAPISLRAFRPIDPSNFSAGMEEFESAVFSLSFGQTEWGVRDSFVSVQSKINSTLREDLIMLLVVVVLALLLVLAVSRRLALLVAHPVSELYSLVLSINR